MTNRDNQGNFTSAQSENKGSSASEGGKDPKRVQAGKKAAETRGHESLAEAGRKGGERSQGGKGRGGQQS